MRFSFFLYFFFLLLPIGVFAQTGYVEPWGKDSDLSLPKFITNQAPEYTLPVRIARQVILFHQNVISPVDGPRSHFRPTSSKYMMLAMQKYGFTKGFIMGCDRLLRENKDPWIYRSIEINGELYKYDPP